MHFVKTINAVSNRLFQLVFPRLKINYEAMNIRTFISTKRRITRNCDQQEVRLLKTDVN